MAPGYTLGALTREESDQIADHRLLCPECDLALDRLGFSTSLIGLAVPQRSPSADLKSRLMAIVAQEPSLDSAPVEMAVNRALDTSSRLTRIWWRHPLISVAPLVLLLFGLGGWSITTHRQLATRSDHISQLERSNEAMTVHLSSLQAGQLAFGADASSFQLMSVNEGANDAGGVVVSGVGNTTTVFSIWNMPDGHQTYHVVCESRLGELLAAGEIIVNDNGNGTVTLQLPAPVSEYRAIHVLPTTDGMADPTEMLTNDILQALFQDPTAVPATDQ